MGWGGGDQESDREGPDLETILGKLDFILSVIGFEKGNTMISLVFKLSLRLLHGEQTSGVRVEQGGIRRSLSIEKGGILCSD